LIVRKKDLPLPEILIATSFSAVVIAVCGWTECGSFDVFWHLATGRLILATGALPAVDPFSFSYGGSPWHYMDALADALLLGLHEAGGWAAVSMLKALPPLAALLCCSLTLQKVGPWRLPLALGLSGLCIPAFQYRLVERPLLFSLAAFPLLLFAMDRLMDPRQDSPRSGLGWVRRALLPIAIVWIWTCLHRGALLGHVYFLSASAFAISTWLASRLRFMSQWRIGGRQLAMVTSAAIAAVGVSLLNPCGIATFTTSLAVPGSELLREHISEWAHVTPGEYLRQFPWSVAFVAASFIVIGLGLARLVRAKSIRLPQMLFHVGWLALLAWQTLVTVHWLPYLVLACCFVDALTLREVPWSPIVATARLRLLCSTLAIVLFAALSLSFGRATLGVGLKEDHLPNRALEFAHEVGLQGRVANTFAFGGYVIWSSWPRNHVLADGRNEMVYPFSFVRQVIESEHDPRGFEALDRKYGFDWVLANNHVGFASHLFLANDSRWRLVYWSEAALIYVRAPLASRLVDHAFKWIHPASVDVSVARAVTAASSDPAIDAELRSEIERMLEASPSGLRSLTALIVYSHLKGEGNWPQRDAAMARLQSLFPDNPTVEELHARIWGQTSPPK
jgi:hypothetical protein